MYAAEYSVVLYTVVTSIDYFHAGFLPFWEIGLMVLALSRGCGGGLYLVDVELEDLVAVRDTPAGTGVGRGAPFDVDGARPDWWGIRPPRGGAVADWGRRFGGLGAWMELLLAAWELACLSPAFRSTPRAQWKHILADFRSPLDFATSP